MPKIKTEILIKANRDVVFDLARSVDFHQTSTAQTNEKAIAGKTSGLMNLGDSVTWRAKHLGIYQNLTSKITEMNYPNYFVDEMVKGAFKSFYHRHDFIDKDGATLMIDTFDYTSPFGIIGRFADWLFLENYMRRFLLDRNMMIKDEAEGKNEN